MAQDVSLNDFCSGCHFSARTLEIQSISGYDEGLGSKTGIDPIDPCQFFVIILVIDMGVTKVEDPSAVSTAPASALLMAASKHVAVTCSKVNAAYIECKDRNNGNPSACLKEGEAVTGCVVNLLKDLNSRCPEQLKSYCECMDYYSNRFSKCRKEQAAFEECAPL